MNSSFERYFADISKFDRITPQREAELSDIIQAGTNEEQTEAAMTELVHANLLLVVHCLKQFRRYLSSPIIQITEMDLIAEGNIGLVKAARGFKANYKADHDDETSSSVRFSSYACKCINSYMRRALKQGRFIHIPEHHFSYWTALGKLREEHGDDLHHEDVSEKLNVSNEVLDLLKQGESTRAHALEDMTTDDGASCWQDILPNENSLRPDDATDTSLLKALLLAEMDKLPERTRNMISELYFEESAPTLREMAGRHGISSERCRQVCAHGLHKLRQQLAGRTHQIDPNMIPSLVNVAA
jgi:RNA polymerase sigma factor (sigma-70 family)